MRQRYLDFVRKQIIGNDLLFETPYGLRNMFYADYTASGRGLRFIEEKLLRIQKSYANTHTEDDFSGKYLTGLFHQAETRIKRMVNAGEHGKIFPVGSLAEINMNKDGESYFDAIFFSPHKLERCFL